MAIVIKKIKPMFTSVITTMCKYDSDEVKESGLLDSAKQQGTLKEYQTVLAIGDLVRNVKVGDLVCINPSRFAVKKHREGSMRDGVITDNPVITYNFDTILLDGKQCLLLQDRDIEYIIEEYEEIPDSLPQTAVEEQSENKLIV